MTAPVQPQQPQATQFAPRQFAGRRASGGGGFSPSGAVAGDGSPRAQGLSQMPQGQAQPNWQTSHPPQSSQSPGAQPTFAQMQANGQARPAPQQVQPVQQPTGPQNMQGGIGGQLQSAVSNALATPSRYDLPQVQQVQGALTSQLQQQFGAQQKQLDEEMERRGIGASSMAAGYNGDLAGQQSTALANMNASLIQNAAQANAQDLSASLGAGQAYQTGQQNYQLGQGALGVQQQQANTAQQGVQNQYALGQGQLGLGEQQLQQSGQQFGQNLALQSQLGLGNLGVSQQQANTAATSAANQYALGQGQLGVQQQQVANQANQFQQTYAQDAQQFGQTYALQQAQQALNQQVQTGQLSIAQANQQLAQLQNQQQYGLQTQAQQLAQTLGLGNLANTQQQTANQASQFGQSFGLQQQAQNASQQQFQQSLAQALQLGTMSDTTANRGLDIQQQQGQNALLEELAMMGIGGTGAGGGTGTGGSGASGTGGPNTNTASDFLNGPAGQQMMQTDPALYARMQLATNGQNINAASANNTTTVNFNGQQYTPAQYYQLMESNPSLFQTKTAQQNADAANAPFFAANAARTAQTHQQQAAQQQAAQLAAQQQAGALPYPSTPATTHYSSVVSSAQDDPAYQQLAALSPADRQSAMNALMAKYSGANSASPGDYGSTIYNPLYTMSEESPSDYQRWGYLQQLLGS